jgi:hypothetical protein
VNKEFKYSAEHAKLVCNCLTEDKLEAVSALAYRFVYEDPTHTNCSSPNMKVTPNRKPRPHEDPCSLWALSFWKNYDYAVAKLKFLIKQNKNFATTVGDYIAECQINPEDGLAEKGEVHHINLHEFEGIDFTNRFTNLKQIKG